MPNPIQEIRGRANSGKMSDEAGGYNAEAGAPGSVAPKATPRDYSAKASNPAPGKLPAKNLKKA